MFRKILIANRGEIALRVLRACRTLGIEASSSTAKLTANRCRSSLPTRRSASAPPTRVARTCRRRQSFRPRSSPTATRSTRLRLPVRGRGLRGRGGRARPDVHRPARRRERFGSKEATRRLLGSARLPTILGSDGMLRDDLHALGEAERIGYPVLIKPSAGGGGKGMRMVRTARELESALRVCCSEAKAAFGDDSLYPRSGSTRTATSRSRWRSTAMGACVHLGERDCSVQRRHQKIIEEAPTPAPTTAAREDLADRAIRAVVAAGYENIGTLEFLVDRDDNPYFIEINCRIQVEHPVTEMLTGIDLIAATQIRIAKGEPLGFSQSDAGAARPRDRVPHQRRGSWRTSSARRRASSSATTRLAGPGSGWTRICTRATRSRRSTTRPRQAHRLGPGPGGRDCPRPRGARRAAGRGDCHERLDPQGPARQRGIPRGPHDDQPAGPRRGCGACRRRRSPVTVFEPAVRGGCCVQGVEHSERGP